MVMKPDEKLILVRDAHDFVGESNLFMDKYNTSWGMSSEDATEVHT